MTMSEVTEAPSVVLTYPGGGYRKRTPSLPDIYPEPNKAWRVRMLHRYVPD